MLKYLCYWAIRIANILLKLLGLIGILKLIILIVFLRFLWHNIGL